MVSRVVKILVKYCLILCNVLLCAFGLMMFILAVLIRHKDGVRAYTAHLLVEDSDQLKTDMIVIAVVGFMMFVVGAAAVIGAGFENLLALRAFVVLISLIALTQLTYSIVLISMKEKIKSRVYRDIAVYVINYDLQSDQLRSHFDEMQRTGNCCGCHGARDFKKLRTPAPDSCTASARTGCCPVVWRGIKKLAVVFGVIAMAVGLLEYLAVLFTFVLISDLQKSHYDVKASSKSNLESGSKPPVKLVRYSRVESDRE